MGGLQATYAELGRKFAYEDGVRQIRPRNNLRSFYSHGTA